jgi:hypothetical protein
VSERAALRAPRALVLLLGAVAFAGAAYFLPGASWSPVSRFCLTRAIVENGSLEITPFAPSTGDRAQVSDRYYTDKGPVPSVLAVPAYAVFYGVAKLRHKLPAYRAEGTPADPARHVAPSPAFRAGLYVCSLATSAVAFAGLSWALFAVLRRRVSLEAAALGTLATLFGTPLFPYATSFFDHTTAAALLFGAFALLDPMSGRTPRATLAAGTLLALAVGTEYVAALPAIVVGATAMVRPRAPAPSRLLLGAAVPLALLACYDWVCFGSPMKTGYSFITHPGFAAGQSSGFFGITWPRPAALFGILFGSSRGLFYVSPLLLLALVQGIREWRRRRDPALLIGALVFSLLLLVNSSYYLWDGGRALGPRHLVPALGFAGVGTGYAFERLRPLAAALAGISVVIIVLGTAVGLEVPERLDVIFDYVVPNIREGHIARAPGASNLGLLCSLGPRASVVPLALGVVAAFVAATRLARRPLPDASPDLPEE